MVAHRSPLGVAGVPPSVATVRGTAGPEPMAMYLGLIRSKMVGAEENPLGKKNEPRVANLSWGASWGGDFFCLCDFVCKVGFRKTNNLGVVRIYK